MSASGVKTFSAGSWGLISSLLFSICTILPAPASETKSTFERMVLLMAADHKAPAIKEFAVYLRSHARDVDVLSMQARLLVQSDRLAEAKSMAERCLAIDANNASALNTRGYCRIVARDYEGALHDLEQAVKYEQPRALVPVQEGKFKNLAALYRVTGRKALVADALRKAKLETLVEKAATCRETGAIDESLKLLDTVIASQSDFYSARLLRAVIFNNTGKFRQSIKDLDFLIEAFPKNAWFYYLRADAYAESGDKALANSDLQTVLLLKPRLVAVYFAAQIGRVRESFEGKDENIVNDADIYYLLGSHYVDLNKFAQAKNAFDRCIALDGAEFKAYFDRAGLARRAKNNQAALKDLGAAIRIKPKYADAYLERAKLEETEKNFAAALRDYNQIAAISPGEYGPFVMRADYLLRQKQFASALSDYDQAIKLSPKEADIYISRGQTHEAMKQYSQAIFDYQQALKLSPGDRSLLQANIARVTKLGHGK